MADVTDITPHLDALDGDLDKLEEAVKPLMADMAEVASKLPLLDKAKLYVLATYSIETALFSALRLNGTDAKAHPVFTELARVRQYYEKIKKAEEPPEQRTQGVNTQAAIRFIKADLVSLAHNGESGTGAVIYILDATPSPTPSRYVLI